MTTPRPRSAAALTRAVRFLVIGGGTTVAYLALYALLRLWLGSQLANVTALVLTADANTLLNRRWTFGLAGGSRAWADRWKGSAAFLVSLVLTSAALWLLAATPYDSHGAQLVVLLAANAVAGVAHFLLLRAWAFRPPGARGTTPALLGRCAA